MTAPHLMNCAHMANGWCLECVKKQAAEIERLRADAARYRWLREQTWHDKGLTVTDAKNVHLGSYCPNNELLDAAIDAAMKGETP